MSRLFFIEKTILVKRTGKNTILLTAGRDAIADYKAKFAEILDAFNT